MTAHARIAAALAQACINNGERLRMRINGTSMRPLLDVGDWVCVERVDRSMLHRGDIVTLVHENNLLTHRLLKMNDVQCTTKGDHCCSVDPLVPLAKVVGRVVMLERRGVIIDLRHAWWQRVGRLAAWVSGGESVLVRSTRPAICPMVHIVVRTVMRCIFGFMIMMENVWFQCRTQS